MNPSRLFILRPVATSLLMLAIQVIQQIQKDARMREAADSIRTEVGVMRERLDTVERLLDSQGSVTRAAIEAYRPDAKVEAERNAWRDEFLKRVYRMHPAEQ